MMYLTFAATGLFLIAAAVFDWDLWFVDWETGFVGVGAGERAARWCQGFVGVGITFVALLYALGGR